VRRLIGTVAVGFGVAAVLVGLVALVAVAVVTVR
jgi:hypothetical protein